MVATPVGARIRLLGLSGYSEERFMVILKNMLIVFMKCDFPTPAPAVINNITGSMETLLVEFVALIFFLRHSWTALSILRCCVFKDKIKLFNSS